MTGWSNSMAWYGIVWNNWIFDWMVIDSLVKKTMTGPYNCWLVVRNIFYFPINIGLLIIPIDELIFFRGVAQPPTRLDEPQYGPVKSNGPMVAWDDSKPLVFSSGETTIFLRNRVARGPRAFRGFVQEKNTCFLEVV